MNRIHLVGRFHVLLLLVLVAITATAYARVPAGANLPVHWGPSGQADWYWPKTFALLIMPVISLLLVGLFAGVDRFSSRDTIESARHVMNAALSAMLGLFTAIQFGVLLIGIGSDVDMVRLISFAVAVLLLVLGNELPKSQRNAYAGLRLPWVMNDAANWTRTHRLTGLLFMAAGLGLALVAWLWPAPGTLIFVLLAAVSLPTAAGGLYSLAIRKRAN